MYLQLIKSLYAWCEFQSVDITGKWWLPVLRELKQKQTFY